MPSHTLLDPLTQEAAAVQARIAENIAATQSLLRGTIAAQTAEVAELIADALRSGHKLLLFGNGGSAADATHLAAELVGRFRFDRAPLPALSLSDNASSVSGIGNDYGYADVFARQVEGLGRPGDVLVAITTSGRSENVLRAAAKARAKGMTVVAFLGPAASPLDQEAEVALHVDGDIAGLVQQGHITIGHAICGRVEHRLAGGR